MVKDIENKIIEFIKRSPVGVTSSEIAKFLGINRVTITKYLAIIRQKAKIDFKQFGMAKMWYIPVDLSQISFLKDMITGISQNIDSKQLKESINKTSSKIGKNISDLYKRFHNTEKLAKSQITDSIIDAMNKLGAKFSLIAENDDIITLRNTRCLFNDIKGCPMLCMVTSGIIGTIVAENLGYGRVAFRKNMSKGSNEDIITIHLKKTNY